MWHAWGRGEVFTGFWLGGPKLRSLRRPRRRWEVTLSWTSGKLGSMGQTGFGWLKIWSSGGLL